MGALRSLPGRSGGRAYHWIFTAQWPLHGVGPLVVATYDGVTTVCPGETRQEIYQSVRTYAADHLDVPMNANTLAFALAPNELEV